MPTYAGHAPAIRRKGVWSSTSTALVFIAVILSLGFIAITLGGLVALWIVRGWWGAIIPIVGIGFVLFQSWRGIRAQRAESRSSQDPYRRRRTHGTPEEY
jgi:hypothetical protein